MWDALLSYNYKGNVRELKNVIERLVVLSEDGVIALEDLPERWPRLPIRRYLTPEWMKWNE